MFEKKLSETIKQEERSMCEILGNNESCLSELIEIISKGGITEKTYAQVFRLMYYFKETGEKVSFDVIDKIWIRGQESISDMETIFLFSLTAKIIRIYIDYSWHSCQLNAISAAWLSTKEYSKTIAALKGMESFSKIRSCLKIAAEIMPSEEQDAARIDWAKIEGNGEYEEEDEDSTEASN